MKSVICLIVMLFRLCRHFNPHTCEGGVILLNDCFQFNMMILIRTPVRGVILMFMLSVAPTTDFNPHTREGCDLVDQYNSVSLLSIFQSAHP